jgi:hypothetical protein
MQQAHRLYQFLRFGRTGFPVSEMPPPSPRAPRPSPVSEVDLQPRADRVRRAFTQVPLSGLERRVLSALAEHPDSTARDLSALCGWRGNVWQSHLAVLCARRRDTLWPQGGPDMEEQGCFLHGLLTHYDPAESTFRMRSDVRAALEDIGALD